jgi:uncharacterized membrane protein
MGREPDLGAPSRLPADPFGRNDLPLLSLTLWPNRSISPRGASVVLGLIAGFMTLPLLAVGGALVGWGLLPFMIAALVGLYLAMRRSYADGRLTEELRLWPDLITVVRREPRGAVHRWHANPAWVRLHIFDDAPIEKYLTLSGNGREIELGAFLSPDERVALHGRLCAALARLQPV